MSYLWLALAITAELTGTLSMRASDGFRRRCWLVPMGLGYIASFGFLALALAAGMPVGAAYAVWSAVGIVLVALLARAIWRDPLTLRMTMGFAIITLGVVLVELG
ncbi:DMT family transporter [Gordonia neofelifaecis]|uniref:Transporter, small multidrug resistance (SMR) family protein n=1 Tax=Gordonia neofelifaecis NRRL B-59395 TaxID=644548 RepID=F1YNK0_9ACTN|nr:multidrug efflux SMR transporter [Gordonia neofelifaecis]EGD53737.1 transporter, small multidrug resistance (SMR) family protein [Gordonia neofelifaecis NRRL B-59395]